MLPILGETTLPTSADFLIFDDHSKYKITMYPIQKILTLSMFTCALCADPMHSLPDYEVRDRAANAMGIASFGSVGSVDQSDLEYRPLLRTGEVLEVVPGLIVTQHSGTGKANQYFLRGFNLDHGTDFATYVDGMPVNMVSHAHGQGYSDVNFIIPELIDVVNYTKGPYYAALGDFSSAGSAQIKTADWLDQGMLKLGFGGDGYLRTVIADAFDLNATDRMVVGLEAQYYDGPWDIGENLNQFKGFAKYTRQIDMGDLSFTFHGYQASWDSADQIPERAVEHGTISDLGSLDQDVGGESSRYSLSADYQQVLGDQSSSLSAYAIYYDINLWSNFTYYLDDPVNGDEFEQAENRIIYGFNFAHSLLHEHLFERDVRHTFGTQVRYDVIDNLGLYHTAGRERLDAVRVDDVRELAAGLFYENEIYWTDRLRSVFGLRADYYAFDVESDLDVNSGSADDLILSPKFSMLYALNRQVELYASFGLGFHSNDARGTTITVDPKDLSAVDAVDPLVRSTGAEVGLHVDWNPQWRTALSVWWLELDSELLYVGDGGATEASGGSERYGMELSHDYHPVDWLSFDLDLALTQARFENGDEIPGALNSVLSGGVTYQSESGFFAGLRARYFGRRPLVEDGSLESDPSLVFNLRTGYDFSPNLRLSFDVLNLFDSNDDDITYYYESKLSTEVASVEDVHSHVIEPRSFRITLTYRY
ncbi:TonB-dependent receptor [Coraliomargarita sp. SDUM461004]|uniref:TonB-dependent receptor n=1 Tax=Thalassobacterium sedimentorum TaxID=3041258 RepID=A0ABU1AJR2_9BACT|nr:TonB-dependent receptor [Coraliomargarita sp. SDUM461004]MDQ8194403.1 TonB-dependent receptor [Coraliomargarita sp. SDUM461004]